MNKLKQVFTTGMVAVGVMIGVVALTVPAYAESPAAQVTKGVNAADAGKDDKNCGPEGSKRKCTLNDTIQTVINVLLFVIGAVSVIMIILGGLKYTLSNGDSSQITSAKNTILYAIIGLVVVALAQVIVRFVLQKAVNAGA